MFPTQYFSIKWEGFLQARFTETYTISVDAFKSSQFYVYLNDVLILSNEFNTTNLNELPHSAFFKSQEINLNSGYLYKLEVRYAEKISLSKVKLYWESDSQPFSVVGS